MLEVEMVHASTPRPSYLNATKRTTSTCLSSEHSSHNWCTASQGHRQPTRRKDRELSDARRHARYANLQRDNNADDNCRVTVSRRLRSATTKSSGANVGMQMLDTWSSTPTCRRRAGQLRCQQDVKQNQDKSETQSQSLLDTSRRRCDLRSSWRRR